MEIINKKECVGCYACYSICPKNAIDMIENAKGFKEYFINKDKCIECGLCKKVCPVLNKKEINNIPKAFAIINKNENVRKESSSGGIFTLIAEYVLEHNGVVFGAIWGNNLKVNHYYIEKKEDINLMRGSKYLQSTIGNTYKKAKEFLDNGRNVLFTGTPCQIEGLKSYLMKDYNNLYTQDIICHGVPSSKVHSQYLNYLKNKYNEKNIKKLLHRTKINGWKTWSVNINFESNTYCNTHKEDLFMQAFLRNTSLRDSCYNCHFKKKNRISDITLADFWGIEHILPELDDNKGTSLVIINSQKGQELFNSIKKNTIYKEVNLDDAIKYNPSMITSVKEDKNREKFFENLDKMNFDELVKKYTYKPNIFRKIIGKIKRMMKKVIKGK